MRPPYKKFNAQELILRDLLAIDRTILAGKRTFLSYLRTSLTLLVAGFSAFHFLIIPWLRWLGLSFILFSVLLFVFGLIDYAKFKKNLSSVLEQ